MLSRRYWPGVLLTIPIGVVLGLWAGSAFDQLGTGWGSPGALVAPGMMLGGGTALGAMVGGLLATRRVDAPAGSPMHLLAVAVGAASGTVGFWVVVAVTVTVFTGLYLLQLLVALATVSAVVAGLVSAAGVALADVTAWATRPRAT